MSQAGKSSDELPPIATLLTPEERLRVDAAGEGCYRTLHRETVDDLIRDLKSRQVHAVLVSNDDHLLRARDQLPPLALTSPSTPKASH